MDDSMCEIDVLLIALPCSGLVVLLLSRNFIIEFDYDDCENDVF